MSKNIEKIKGEDALSEIVSVTLDDAKLNGLVSNDVADMYQNASGLTPIKPIDTYESSIVELKTNLKLIFRRLFSVPFTMLGSNKEESPVSIIEMIKQMFNHYRERLKGSETYGIPSSLDQLTDLTSATALLTDRKIFAGSDTISDGAGLLALLCNTTQNSAVEDIYDNNVLSWGKPLPNIFPNLKRITLDIEELHDTHIIDCQTNIFNNLEEINLPKLKRLINATITHCGDNNGLNGLHTITLPELAYVSNSCICYTTRNGNNTLALREIHFIKLETIVYGNTYPFFQAGSPADHIKLYFYSLEQATGNGSFFWWNANAVLYMYIGYKTNDSTKHIIINETHSHGLQDLELKSGWRKPINVAGCTSLTAENMYNHILCRLKQDEVECGSGVTITLGTTNIEKLEAVEEYNAKLTELEDIYGYTFA